MKEKLEEMKKIVEAKQNLKTMDEEIKSMRNEIKRLQAEEGMIELESKLKQLKQKEIDKKQQELQAKITERENKNKEIIENTDNLKEASKTLIESEMSTYKTRDEIEKQRPEIEQYTEGITNLSKEVETLEKELQEITEEVKNGNVSRMERMNSVAALIRSDKARIANMENKVNEFNNYKVLEDHIQEYSDLEHMLMRVNGDWDIEKEIKMIESEVEHKKPEPKKPEEKKPEPKAKNEYDWGELTEDQIDELWAEGITPDSQEYKQAYGNFVKMPPYVPEVHDIDSGSNPNPGTDPLPKPGTKDFQPPAVVPDSEERIEAILDFLATVTTPFRFIGRNLVVRPFKFITRKIRGMQAEVIADDQTYEEMQAKKAEEKEKQEETKPQDIDKTEDALDRMIRERDEAAKNGTGRPRLDGEGKPLKPWEAKEDIAKGVKKIMEEEKSKAGQETKPKPKPKPAWEVSPEKARKINRSAEKLGREAAKQNKQPKQPKPKSKAKQTEKGRDGK